MALNEHIPHPHHALLPFQEQHQDFRSLHACPSAGLSATHPARPVSGSCPDSFAGLALQLHPAVAGASPASGNPLCLTLGPALPCSESGKGR